MLMVNSNQKYIDISGPLTHSPPQALFPPRKVCYSTCFLRIIFQNTTYIYMLYLADVDE